MGNVTRNHTLFPTIVNEFKYVADEKLRSYIVKEEFKQMTKRHSRTSVSNLLHKKVEYKGIVNKIMRTTKEVCDFYIFIYDEIEITNMWLNFSKAGDVHRTHNHSNNIFSGVWYPFSNSQTSIYFYDPRAVANFWLPNKKENNIINSSGWSMPNKQNLGLIFPSWLYHSVPPADGERISLSWNIILRGEYGEPNTLQNAHI